MKRVCLIVVLLLVCGGAQVYGAQFGPLKAATEARGFSVGLGYTYQPDEWDLGVDGQNRIKTQQHQAYLQVGSSVGSSLDWFGRVGLANWKADDPYRFSDNAEMEGDVQPYLGGGLSVALKRGDTLTVSPFLQGSYVFLEYEANAPGSGSVVSPLVTVTYVGKEFVYFKNMWEVDAGVKFQLNIEGATLYFGPAYYLCNAEYRSNFAGTATDGSGAKIIDTETADVESANKFGGFAGVLWTLDEHYVLELEAQYKSDLAVSGLLSYRF